MMRHYVPPSVLGPLFDVAKDHRNEWGQVVNAESVAKKYYELTFKYSGRGDSLKRGIIKEDKIADRIQCKAVAEIIYNILSPNDILTTMKDGVMAQRFRISLFYLNKFIVIWESIFHEINEYPESLDFTFPFANKFQLIKLSDLSEVLKIKVMISIYNYFTSVDKSIKFNSFEHKGELLHETEFNFNESWFWVCSDRSLRKSEPVFNFILKIANHESITYPVHPFF
jgi:hypothetical protein